MLTFYLGEAMNNIVRDAAAKLAMAWFMHDPKLIADTVHFTSFDAFFLFGVSDPVTITIRREISNQDGGVKIEKHEMANA